MPTAKNAPEHEVLSAVYFFGKTATAGSKITAQWKPTPDNSGEIDLLITHNARDENGRPEFDRIEINSMDINNLDELIQVLAYMRNHLAKKFPEMGEWKRVQH